MVEVAASVSCLLALAACGGEGKQAQSPGTCPTGTVLKGEDCVAESVAQKGDDDWEKGSTKDMPSSKDPPAPTTPPVEEPSATSTDSSYDKDAVEAQLRRAAKQVKDNCGSASDDQGNKSGPWGPTTATIVLGRNGHVQDVSVPSPFSGKPVGDCVARSFKKIQFPPYAGSSDVSVSWSVEIAQPKK
jgi:hypothetical protein